LEGSYLLMSGWNGDRMGLGWVPCRVRTYLCRDGLRFDSLVGFVPTYGGRSLVGFVPTYVGIKLCDLSPPAGWSASRLERLGCLGGALYFNVEDKVKDEAHWSSLTPGSLLPPAGRENLGLSRGRSLRPKPGWFRHYSRFTIHGENPLRNGN